MEPHIRADLLMRLEALDTDYREAVSSARQASTLLLVVSLLYLLGSVGLAFLQSAAEVPAGAVLGLRVAVGVVLLACALVARRAPAAGLAIAAATWLVAQAVLGALSPGGLLLSFLSAGGIALLFAKVVLLVILVRGFLAARSARDILAREEAGR